MIIHEGLTYERWFKLSLVEQLANIRTDVERAIRWKNRGNQEASIHALYRALDLIDFTVADPKNKKRGTLREILRVREARVDYFMYDNVYGSSDEAWQK